MPSAQIHAVSLGTFDTSGSDGVQTNTITVGSQPFRALFACAMWQDAVAGSAAVSSVSSSVDGALSAISGASATRANVSSDSGVAWYRLINPTAGAHTITLTMSETTDVIGLVLFAVHNVHQTTPTGGGTSGNSAGSFSINITSDVGDLCLAASVFPTSNRNEGKPSTGVFVGDVWENTFWGTVGTVHRNTATSATTTFTYTNAGSRDAVAAGFAIKCSDNTPQQRTRRPRSRMHESDDSSPYFLNDVRAWLRSAGGVLVPA